MSEILSQDEINALLSAYESASTAPTAVVGEVKRDTQVRLYDFTRPDRFSKDHLRMLRNIHSNFAGGLSTALSNLYQVPTRINLIGVDQMSFKEYLVSIPSETLLAELSVQPLSNSLLFEVNPSVVGIWLDCLCGGNPDIASEPSELTAIDLAVAKKIISICQQEYKECWSGVTELQSELSQIVNSESYQSSLLAAELVLVCSFEIYVGQSMGMMTVCIPAAGIDSVLPALSEARVTRGSNWQPDKAAEANMKRVLAPINLDCRIVLGRTQIPLAEAVDLAVGDIIRTDQKVEAEMEMWVGEKHMFNCRPGVSGGNVAVMVTSTNTTVEENSIIENESAAQRIMAEAA